MSDNTKIEWTDATLNYVNGCTVHSPGCKLCYAMKQAHRFPVRQGLTKPSNGGMVWTGELRNHEPALLQALRWTRPRSIFWNAHGDLFHKDTPIDWIDRQMAVIALTPHHRHLVLTKRSDVMRKYFDGFWETRIMRHMRDLQTLPAGFDRESYGVLLETRDGMLDQLWLGVSVEDKDHAFRLDDLRETHTANRFVSFEPLLEDLGDVDLTDIDWAIVGGESGAKARSFEADWARNILSHCRKHNTAFFMKQMGGAIKSKMPPIPDDLLIQEIPS